jgi:hypothetical protein
VGVNVTDSGRDPAPTTVPSTGEYANVPGTEAVAFNCVPLSAVPYVIAAGVVQVIIGVAGTTMTAALAVSGMGLPTLFANEPARSMNEANAL